MTQSRQTGSGGHQGNGQLSGPMTEMFGERPRQDSNLRTRLRRPLLYPLSYGGSGREKDYQYPA